MIKKGEEKYAEEMKKYCKEVMYFYRSERPFTPRNILRTGLSLYPFVVMRNLSDKGRRALERKLKTEKFDVIHVETFYLRPHLPKTSTPIVLVDQTIEYQVYQHHTQTMRWWFLRPIFIIDVFKLKYWETRFWREAARVVAVSDSDAEKMRDQVPGLAVDTIPNAPGDDLISVYNERSRPDLTAPKIFYQSNFFWMQNVEGARYLAENVFPLIRKAYPKAVCRVVGQMAKEKVGDLAGNGVEVVDLETSDIEGVRKAYREGTVFVAPLWGPGGTRLKILSAMSTGVPVVTTSVGAGGLEVTDGKHLMIGDDAAVMAKKVIEILKKPAIYESLKKNARKLIEEKYSWDKIAVDLSHVYEEVAKGN